MTQQSRSEPLSLAELRYLLSEVSEEFRGFPWPAEAKRRNLASFDRAIRELIAIRERKAEYNAFPGLMGNVEEHDRYLDMSMAYARLRKAAEPLRNLRQWRKSDGSVYWSVDGLTEKDVEAFLAALEEDK